MHAGRDELIGSIVHQQTRRGLTAPRAILPPSTPSDAERAWATRRSNKHRQNVESSLDAAERPSLAVHISAPETSTRTLPTARCPLPTARCPQHAVHHQLVVRGNHARLLSEASETIAAARGNIEIPKSITTPFSRKGRHAWISPPGLGCSSAGLVILGHFISEGSGSC